MGMALVGGSTTYAIRVYCHGSSQGHGRFLWAHCRCGDPSACAASRHDSPCAKKPTKVMGWLLDVTVRVGLVIQFVFHVVGQQVNQLVSTTSSCLVLTVFSLALLALSPGGWQMASL